MKKTISFSKIIFWTGAISLLLVYIILWAEMIASPSERTGTDFIAFYSAGRIAQERGSSKVYDIDLQQEMGSVSEIETDNFDCNSTQIYSSLPMSNPKFRNIVEKFVIRLGDQITTMDTAWQQRDYDQLKKLGHWLKGSSGSVGFTQFVEPAREFEQYAIDKDDNNINASLQVLRALYNRVRIDSEPDSNPAKETTKSIKKYEIPEQLNNRLLKTNPAVRKIVDKFILLLKDKLLVVDDAILNSDFETIQKFAYWIKASGGSVGFDAFTEPARDLESQAKEGKMELIKDTIQVIKLLLSRVKLDELN